MLELAPAIGADLGRDLAAVWQLRHERPQATHDLRVRRRPEIMPIEILELDEVEASSRPPNGIEVEPTDQVVGRHDLVVAVAPAQAHQGVATGRRQVADGTIGLDAKRAMALGKLGAVRTMD